MAPESAGTVFENVRIFDGTAASLSGSSHVLVRGKTIETISSQKIPPADGETLRLIEGANRVLMPGLIDAHWHSMFAELSLVAALTADAGYINILSGKAAARTLQRGFTTVRDAGGPSFGLKKAIDDGLVEGPRIFPSGAFISQTSGHGDYRSHYELPRGICGHHPYSEIVGAAMIADGVDEVLRAVREQLMLGA
jgi:imidazolonepropionase-like amidohydrolase